MEKNYSSLRVTRGHSRGRGAVLPAPWLLRACSVVLRGKIFEYQTKRGLRHLANRFGPSEHPKNGAMISVNPPCHSARYPWGTVRATDGRSAIRSNQSRSFECSSRQRNAGLRASRPRAQIKVIWGRVRGPRIRG